MLPNSDVDDVHIPHRWEDSPEEPPARGAPAIDVARHLYDDIEIGGYFIWGDVGLPVVPITPRQGREFCEATGHAWKSVSPALRQLRARDLMGHITNAPSVIPDGPFAGLAVNKALFDELRAAGWLPPHRTFKTGFNRTNRYERFTIAKQCQSWWCPTCAPRLTRNLLLQVESRIEDHEVLYTGECLFDAKLSGRFRHRAMDHDSEFFWYRRCDDLVFFVSTRPLPGRMPPYLEARPQADVVPWLRAEAMILPGRKGHDWSDGWEPPHTTQDEDEDEDDKEPEWLWFPLNRGEGVEVHHRLLVEIREVYGLDLTRDEVPPEVQAEIEGEILPRIVKEVRESR